ncbi:MAG: hypothetical protein KGL39_39235 [Patescibacteria group bacterium]|nr:hypothetical protein [Patescibacteria group bacterium]
MPFIKNPDGTWTATTPDGAVIGQSIPDSFVPDVAKAEAKALSPNPYEPAPPPSVENAPPEVSPPPMQTLPPEELAPNPYVPDASLMNAGAGAPPPSDMANAVAGTGAAPEPNQSIAPEPVETAPPPPPPPAPNPAAPFLTPDAAPPPASTPANPAAPLGVPPPKPILINPQAGPAPASQGIPASPDSTEWNPAEQKTSVQSAVGAGIRIPVGGGGPVKRIPEHLVPVGGSMTQVIQQPISPEQKAKEDAARAALESAIETSATNSAIQQQNAAAEYAAAKENADKKIADIQTDQAKRAASLEPKIADLQAQQQKLASMKVDPERYWNNKSGFSKVVAVIAMGLLGLKAGMTGGKNEGFELLNQRISEDINAQRAAIDIQKGVIDTDNNILAQERAKWLSPEAAEAATRALMLQGAAAETARQMALTNSTEALNRGRDLIAQLRLAMELQNSAAAKAEAGVEQRLSKVQLAQTVGGQAMLDPRALFEKNLKLTSKLHDASEEGRQAAANDAWKMTSTEIMFRTQKYDKKTGKVSPGVVLPVDMSGSVPGAPGSGIPPQAGDAVSVSAGGAAVSPPPPGAIPPPPAWMTKKQAADYAAKSLEAWNTQQARYRSLNTELLKKNANAATGDARALLERLDNWKAKQDAVFQSKHGTAAAGTLSNFFGFNTPAGQKMADAVGAASEAQTTISSSFLGKTDKSLEYMAKMFPIATTFKSSNEVKAFYDNAKARVISVANGHRWAAQEPVLTEDQFRAATGVPDETLEAPPPEGGVERP